MNLNSLLNIYRWVYVVFIVFASGRTFLSADSLSAHQGAHGAFGAAHLKVLAAAEIVAAIAFLAKPIERIAGAALIVIYAIAATISIAFGEIPAHLFFYAATVLFLVRANILICANSGGSTK